MSAKWIEYDAVSAEMEMGEFLYGLVRMLKPEIVVETGTHLGWTANELGMAVEKNRFGHVFTCDIVASPILAHRFMGLPVTFRQISSLDLPELRIADFIFSDSDQSLRAAEYELAKPGCVFVVHDTAKSYTTNLDQNWLGAWVTSQGGLNFPASRGFGVLVKPANNLQ